MYYKITINLGGNNWSFIRLLLLIFSQKVSKKHLRQWQELQELFDPQANFKTIRHAQKKAQPPCIPFLSNLVKFFSSYWCLLVLVSKDIAGIEENEPNMVANRLVNVYKLRLLCKVASRVSQAQNSPYSFEPNHSLQQYFIDGKPYSEAQLDILCQKAETNRV